MSIDDALLNRCAPDVSPVTLNALIETESGRNPYVVANVTDNTSKYFRTANEAISYVNNLERQGKNYSAGLMGIYSKNFKKYGIDNISVFDVCKNITVGAQIFTENYLNQKGDDEQIKLRKAASRYYSGNDKRGFVKEKVDGKSYVERVEQKAYKVPALQPSSVENQDLTDSSTITIKQQKSSSWDVFGDFK